MAPPGGEFRAGWILRTIEFMGSRSPVAKRAAALTAIAVVGVADWWTGPDLSLAIFYLLPVSMVAWHVGRGWGSALATLSAGIGLIADLMWSDHYGSSMVPWWNAGTRLGILLTLVMILGALHKALDRERMFARTDALTGILNRRAFYDRGKREVLRARRYGHPLSLIYIDLDRFKNINDRSGHTEGDRLLIALARAMTAAIRETDVLARIGGDEFALVLPETGPEAARSMTERLVETIGETMLRNRWAVTISAGVVTFVSPPESVDEMIHQADRVMYEAKRRNEHSVEYEVVDG